MRGRRAPLRGSPIEVDIPHSSNAHLGQIYVGFQMLEGLGLVRIKWVEPNRPLVAPVMSVTLSGSIRVTYDEMDGLNWIPGTHMDNLEHFQRTAPQGWYFKRSYHRDLASYAPQGCRVAPLGLNYHITPRYRWTMRSLREHTEGLVRRSRLARSLLSIQGATVRAEDVVGHPQLHGPNRVLLRTRLWSTSAPEVLGDQIAIAERSAINERRVEMVKSVKREFHDHASVGIYSDAFSQRNAPADLLSPRSVTDKAAYLDEMRLHSICVATTGLHGSAGWRFGEYVAGARAILTEPLMYESPGLEAGVNYVEYAESDSLLRGIDRLLTDRRLVVAMMVANSDYYATRLRPDRLVLHSLLTALGLDDAAGEASVR